MAEHVAAVPIVVLMTLVVDGRVFDPMVVDGVGHRHGPVSRVSVDSGGAVRTGSSGGPRCTKRSVFEIRLGGRARANWRGIVYARNGRISRSRVLHGVNCCGPVKGNYRQSPIVASLRNTPKGYVRRKLCAYDDEQITKDEILRTGQFVGNLFVASRITGDVPTVLPRRVVLL